MRSLARHNRFSWLLLLALLAPLSGAQDPGSMASKVSKPATCADAQVLKWNATSSQYECQPDNTGGGGGIAFRAVTLLAKDVTKTNIGTAYVNIAVGATGERQLVDFAGFTQFRVLIHWNLVGSGTQNVRVVDQVTQTNVLFESTGQTGAGEKEIDSGWTALPGWATGEKFLVVQGKSTTGADDPVHRRTTLYLK